MTGLLQKRDWLEAKARLSAWWRHEALDRPVVELTAPRATPLPGPEPVPPPADPERAWLAFPARLERAEAALRRTAFLGEAVPGVTPGLGPGSLGLFLGARGSFFERTVWYDPCFDDIGTAHLQWDEANPYWQWTLESTRLALSRGVGRWVVEMPDLIENLDTLAALVGTLPLLEWLVTAPEEVHRLQRDLVPLWFRAFDPLYEMIGPGEGGNAWLCFKAWAPGRMAKLQCDLSAMISPAMFEAFVWPYLAEQAAGLDFVMYHLDGPDAVKHLERVLAVPGLDVLQWTPGSGQGHGGDPAYDFIYRAALDAGKGVHATMPIEAVPAFVKRLGPSGLYISTTAPTEAEGRRLLAELA